MTERRLQISTVSGDADQSGQDFAVSGSAPMRLLQDRHGSLGIPTGVEGDRVDVGEPGGVRPERS